MKLVHSESEAGLKHGPQSDMDCSILHYSRLPDQGHATIPRAKSKAERVFPRLTCYSSPYPATMASLAINEMTTAFHLDTLKTHHVRKRMNEQEKAEYRARRRLRACEVCAAKKTKVSM